MATYTVVRGDCLWTIAARYLGSGTYWTTLADLNNISRSNPIIYPGQVLQLSSSGSSSSSSSQSVSSQTNNSNKPIIDYFGLQAGTDKTVFATWSWSKSHTASYNVRWYYDTGDHDSKSNTIWFIGEDGSETREQSVYSAPSNAIRVRLVVQAVSETYTSNSTEVSYWTGDWSTESIYSFSSNPPTAPSVPTVSISSYTLTAELENLNVNGTSIQFQVVKNDSTVFNTGTATISTGSASYSCSIEAGGRYKVRCRSCRGDLYSSWSEYSSNINSIPAASDGITTCKAASSTSVYLEWTAVSSATSYELEYTTNKDYFDGSDDVTSITSILQNHYTKTGLQSGSEYFFRVRAVNATGNSAWSETKSTPIGTTPVAPTTWASTTTLETGDPLHLYWAHNDEDGSDQTSAQVEITINGTATTYTVNGTTHVYDPSTASYTEGTTLLWRVRTAGVTATYGEWSVQRTVTIYAPPTLVLTVTNSSNTTFSRLTSFPFTMVAAAGPNTQTPIGYHVVVSPTSSYETTDNVGNTKIVSSGEEIYSKHFNVSTSLSVIFSADNLDLENNVMYKLSCTVTMNSGLTATQSFYFTVAWSDVLYVPNAEIAIDRETLAAYIRPYYEAIQYALLTSEPSDWTTNYNSYYKNTGTSADPIYVRLYATETWAANTYYSANSVPVSGVTLAVYRREFDGGFTEIGKGISNSVGTFVTDPHPALDYARYRVVATTTATGAVAYSDIAGYPVGEKSVIIQWNEKWINFNSTNSDAMAQPVWGGSMLKLPYNIDVSDQNDADISLVEYIGRKHPVGYYGTQLGSSSTWNVEIDKQDIETLYALRRLAIWMGDVYVREPSGSGYWANIKVSFSQKHCELTIPVTLNITRVEGGV